MTTTMTRWFSPLLVCLVLAGCSLPLLEKQVTEEEKQVTEEEKQAAEETELFAQGLDQYIRSGNLTTLELLPQQYPQGEWRTRAEGIIDIADQQRQQQAQFEKKEKELDHCQKEKAFFAQDNQLLEGTLDRLKQVLIDMELRKE
jgi:hypothetical protein